MTVGGRVGNSHVDKPMVVVPRPVVTSDRLPAEVVEQFTSTLLLRPGDHLKTPNNDGKSGATTAWWRRGCHKTSSSTEDGVRNLEIYCSDNADQIRNITWGGIARRNIFRTVVLVT